MSFQIPSLSESREFLRALFKALFPDRNVGSPRSYHSRRLTVLAAATTQLHKHVQSTQDDVMPDTAGDDGAIDRWANINGTGARKSATPARKAAAARVAGTLASTEVVGAEMIHPATGLRFKLTSPVTIPAALFQDADIAAIDTGSATRLLKGEVLELVSPSSGIETNVVLQKDLDEDGFDAEQYGAYRARMLAVFGQPSSGGNQPDFVRWALELLGISQAYCYPNRAGVGTVDVVGLHTGSGSARIPIAGTLTELLTYLKTKAPTTLAGTGGGLRVLTPVADPENVEILVTPNGDAQYAFHWNDATPAVVSAWNGTTRELTFNAARPATMKAGHSIVLKGVGSTQDGREYKIEALVSTDKVILEAAPTNNPVASDIAYSGGPLVAPIRDAILAHMNGETVYAGKKGVPTPASALASTVGLEVLSDGIGPANPAGIYGTWLGGLYRGVLSKITTYKAGVRNHTVVTPASDYEATDHEFPNDSQIGLITPQQVIVRRG